MSTDLPMLGHAHKHTPTEKQFINALARAYDETALSPPVRLQNFPRHIRRQDAARFLAKVELFKMTLNCHGSIVEGGVFAGGGIMTWLHCSSIFEPYNYTRRIIGFDTFEGFPQLREEDETAASHEHLHPGAMRAGDDMQNEIEQLVALHDANRPLGHIPKVQLVPGNAKQTIPQYIREHPHLLISLLYLDFDLYEPTRAALQSLYERVVKGGIVAFDELNCPEYPGETLALLQTLGAGEVKLQRFTFEPSIAYFIKGA